MKQLILAWFCFGLVSTVRGIEAQRAIYLSGNQTLVGCVYKPKGVGPFPAIIFNQATTRSFSSQQRLDPFPQLAEFYTSRGYVLFAPGRHKTGPEEKVDQGKETAEERVKRVMGSYEEEMQNITAGVEWLKAQVYVDPKRMVMTGLASGGASTLLIAQKDSDLKGFIAFSPAMASWNKYPFLQKRLKSAVIAATAPIMVIQAENDENTEPAKVLGYELDKKGKPNQGKIYPAFGLDAKTAHTFALEGSKVWGKDVMTFLDEVLR